MAPLHRCLDTRRKAKHEFSPLKRTRRSEMSGGGSRLAEENDGGIWSVTAKNEVAM